MLRLLFHAVGVRLRLHPRRVQCRTPVRPTWRRRWQRYSEHRLMAYPPEFLQLVDEFIVLANRLAEDGKDGEVSAAILFAAGRYNAFNFLTHGGNDENREQAVDYYVSEYRKALISNIEGVVGPVVKAHG
ncbi:MAG: DUF3144 domain-containing protein [Methylococcaceae bacterium]|nr:DUF3144 domain-containing protein [Methylococcaceae bacterium]